MEKTSNNGRKKGEGKWRRERKSVRQQFQIERERRRVDGWLRVCHVYEEAPWPTRPFGNTPTRIEARHETRCEEAMSTYLHSKKKEARKIEPPQIIFECIEKSLIQLTGAVMEVGYLLKCILVVLVFFGLAFLVKFR